MTHQTENGPYSNLPTFHPVRMELTRIETEQRNNPDMLAARRTAWLKARGL